MNVLSAKSSMEEAGKSVKMALGMLNLKILSAAHEKTHLRLVQRKDMMYSQNEISMEKTIWFISAGFAVAMLHSFVGEKLIFVRIVIEDKKMKSTLMRKLQMSYLNVAVDQIDLWV